MRRPVSFRLHRDPAVSKGISSRVGLGKIRHLDAGLLWIQHHVSRRNLQIDKAAGSENKAKDVNAETITTLMKAMNFKESKERHPC